MYLIGGFIAWLLEGAVGRLFFGEDARPQKYAIAAILMGVSLWLFVRSYTLHSDWADRLWYGTSKWAAVLAAWAFAIAYFARRDPS